MDDTLLKFSLTAFTTLLVVVDPLGILPIFISLTAGQRPEVRAGIVKRAVRAGFVISLLFLVAGHSVLSYLGVTVHAFAISGGILLFATAMPMLFGHRPPLQSSEPGEGPPEDVAIFPLAIPLLAGPGTITSILLLTAETRGNPLKLGTLVLVLAVIFLITRLVLGVFGERLSALLNRSTVHVATRVLGILLAALAVQFVLNGVTEYALLLQAARPHAAAP